VLSVVNIPSGVNLIPSSAHRPSLLAGALLGLIASVVGAAIASLPRDSPPSTAVAQTVPLSTASSTDAANPNLADDQVAAVQPAADPVRRTPVVEAVERVAPAVVSITTEVPVNDPFRRAWGGQRSTVTQGSGVVIESDGVVLTNAHVVSGASRILATFSDGSDYEADILGIDQELDLAVLRLRGAPELTAVPIGSSADLMLGEPTIAIGNPFGLGLTVTTGVISATRRPLETDQRVYQDFLQTDASINPGNSGGPLLNAHGRLIGINTAIRPDAEGIGFAIPVDRAIKVATDLSTYGQVRIPWLGVDLDDVYLSELDREAGRTGRSSSRTAARVVRVHDEDGAAGAGLKRGDVIVAVEGHAVQGRADLNAFLAGFNTGSAVQLTVRRSSPSGGRELTIAVAARTLPDSVIDDSLSRVLGIALSDGEARGGAPISAVAPGGAFAKVGGKPGDAIAAINGQAIHSAADLRTAIATAKSAHRDSALITVRRGNSLSRITLPL